MAVRHTQDAATICTMKWKKLASNMYEGQGPDLANFIELYCDDDRVKCAHFGSCGDMMKIKKTWLNASQKRKSSNSQSYGEDIYSLNDAGEKRYLKVEVPPKSSVLLSDAKGDFTEMVGLGPTAPKCAHNKDVCNIHMSFSFFFEIIFEMYITNLRDIFFFAVLDLFCNYI